MGLQAVFFDMGGTIETYSWTPELRIRETACIQQRLNEAGIYLNLTDKQLFEIISAGLDKYHQTSLQTMDELPPERVWNEYILAGYPVDREILASIAEELMFLIETRYFQRELRPEVPAVLESIHEMGLKIGLISNVNSRTQVPTNLALYGIQHFFNPIVLSSEYGRRKPDPSIFHYAARLASVPTCDCAYVGDRIARDIVGARKAGYRLAVQICHDYDHGEDDSGALPDAIINDMSEVLDILKSEMRDSKESIRSEETLRTIRAVIFDAGDILYYRVNAGSKFAMFLNELGLPNQEFPLEKRTALRNLAYQGLINYTQYQEAILDFYGVTQPEQVARGKQILDEEANNVQFFDGVRETLLSLKSAGFLLGIITDTALPVHVKLNWFERGGFGNVWDSIISSKEMGIRKPNPAIYQIALQQLGVPADQAIFVGHKSSELDGAKAVGMNTIAFNCEEGASADFLIAHFADLLKISLLKKTKAK
jgi:putative hydrolase of the HAD superfamily